MSSYLVELRELDLKRLEWSPTSFKVGEFLNKFSLPQIVKVIEGFYGDDEESSLGADQILTLHVVKSADKISGRDYRGKEVNIPLNCPNKVEIRPSNLKDVYETVDELCTAFPRFVRISQGYYSPSRDEEVLNVGDKLRLKNIDKSRKGQERLVCVNQNGQTIELPRDCLAGFQPLTDGKEYYLAEIVSHFRFPLYVQFVDPPVVGKQSQSPEEMIFNSGLGSIYLENSYTENVVIASTISNDGRRTVVTFPRDMDIRIAVCEGMLRNSANYAQICRSLNNGIDLENLKSMDAYGAFKPRNSVREYSYSELVTYAVPDLSQIKDEFPPEYSSPETGAETKANVAEVEIETPEVKQSEKVAEAAPEWTGANDTKRQKDGEKNSEENGVKEGAFFGNSPPKPARTQNSPAKLTKNDQGYEIVSSAESPEATTADNNTASSHGQKPEPANVDVSEEVTPSTESKVFVTTVSITQPSLRKDPDVSACSVKQVSDILRELGMSKYVVKFEAEMIDGEMLTCLTDDILMSDFGMNKLHCMKLRKYLQGWRPKV